MKLKETEVTVTDLRGLFVDLETQLAAEVVTFILLS